jgi:formylglycine-generating enzyme required for sulfatase activity/serine/threonine protein kinase
MPTPQDLPEQLGRYRILKKLGQGGMGAVYLALDTQLNRQVALKVPHFGPEDGPEIIARFKREAALAASIDHPSLCPVHDVGEVGGFHFFTMPFIEGTSLASLIAGERPWPPGRAVELVRQVALAVSLLHQKGIVHRDLKPGNILVRPTGEPVLLDFGLARSFQSSSQRLTATGATLGTPVYMAPEQVNGDGQAIGPVTDVYSLGMILYELVTGQLPFEGPLMAVYGQVLHAIPAPPSEVVPGLDAALDVLCGKALAKKPEERFASASLFAAALVMYSRGPMTPVSDPELLVPAPLSKGRQTSPVSSPVVRRAESRTDAVTRETCPGCGKSLKVPAGMTGRKVRCPGCGTALVATGTREAPGFRQETQPSSRHETAATPVPAASKAGHSWSDIVLAVVGLFVLLLLAGGAVLVYVNRGEQTTRTDADRHEQRLPPPGPSNPPVRATLRLLPLGPISVRVGERTQVPVRVVRGNARGPVRVRLVAASSGVTLREALIDAGGNEGTLELIVASDAIVGRRELSVEASVDGVADVQKVGLTVRPAPALRLLALGPVTIQAGETGRVPVRIVRTECPGPVQLRLVGSSLGVSIRNGLVKVDDNDGVFELALEGNAAAGKRELSLEARAGTLRDVQKFSLTVQSASQASKIRSPAAGINLVLIRAGTFRMGSPKEEVGRYDDEGPQHSVRITRDFYMGSTEVTVGQFRKFVSATGYKTEGEKAQGSSTWQNNSYSSTDTQPVVYVSWNDAMAFCQWLSKEEGKTYDLPTEAEWEYACRGGLDKAYSFGEDAGQLDQYAWFGTNSGGKSHAVGMKRKNSWGLYDMHGNVWEWCRDGKRTYEDKYIEDPEGPKTGSRVLRGGSWDDPPRNCRSAYRFGGSPEFRGSNVGFRIVLRPPARTP